MQKAGRGKYLGFVAHEIKNPLATALWSCDLLKRLEGPERSGERAEKMIDVSLRALRRMRRLIDDFFTIERLLENAYELKRDRLGLQELTAAAVQFLAEKEGIATEGWIVEVQGDVTGDAEMLRRALRCAALHMARGSPKPRLKLISRPAGAGQELHIAAEEPPAPVLPPEPEERPSGDPFGEVLSFSLAARIVDAHGGRIEERDGGLSLFLP